MPRRERVWSRTPSTQEKDSITAACEDFIARELKPRFLPEVRPTEFNYPIDILGKWHGHRYRFFQRYRSGFPDNKGQEFDSGFTRLDWIGPDRFDVMWCRHTGQWYRLFSGVSLEDCFELILGNSMLHPL